jgi:outer membrane murein-binding lipoprotein Lpp
MNTKRIYLAGALAALTLVLAGCVTPGTDLKACARLAAQVALRADLDRISSDPDRQVNVTVSEPDNGRVRVVVEVMRCPPTGEGDIILCTPRGGWVVTVVDLGLGCRVVEPIWVIVG